MADTVTESRPDDDFALAGLSSRASGSRPSYGQRRAATRSNYGRCESSWRAATRRPKNSVLEEESGVRRLVHCEQSIGGHQLRRGIGAGEPCCRQTLPGRFTE